MSVLIQKSELILLGIADTQDQAVIDAYVEARDKSTKSREEKVGAFMSRAMVSIFGSAYSRNKNSDPLFLLIKNHIIKHEPEIRDMLFEQTPDGKDYVFPPAVASTLTQLKEKDRLEAAFFKGSPVESAAFDEILENEGGLELKPKLEQKTEPKR